MPQMPALLTRMRHSSACSGRGTSLSSIVAGPVMTRDFTVLRDYTLGRGDGSRLRAQGKTFDRLLEDLA